MMARHATYTVARIELDIPGCPAEVGASESPYLLEAARSLVARRDQLGWREETACERFEVLDCGAGLWDVTLRSPL